LGVGVSPTVLLTPNPRDCWGEFKAPPKSLGAWFARVWTVPLPKALLIPLIGPQYGGEGRLVAGIRARVALAVSGLWIVPLQ
jgi:hypothetical protein